jgi:hypothetical protein
MIHLAFYVPDSHLEVVKHAIFKAGAGRIGNYDRCCFETRGVGQFRPLKGSSPYLGKEGSVESVNEVKVELMLEEDLLRQVISALKGAHPYETPAYYALQVLDT